ncbi:MAG: DUF2461 domain-containing protein [Mycobacteriales bacterium]
MSFAGFPDEALVFYEGLEADNSKAYWTDHRHVYDECVAAPMKAMLAELEPDFGAAKVFRPYRDVRFSKDKTPYKTRQDAVVHQGDQAALWLGLGADGLHVGGGLFRPDAEQVRRLRAAVADERTGSALVAVLTELRANGWQVAGEHLKRVPQPWDDSHARADLLRHKSLVARVTHPPQAWLHTPRAKEQVAAGWRALQPLNDWLAQSV